jgi:hypothetical protein
MHTDDFNHEFPGTPNTGLPLWVVGVGDVGDVDGKGYYGLRLMVYDLGFVWCLSSQPKKRGRSFDRVRGPKHPSNVSIITQCQRCQVGVTGVVTTCKENSE